MEEKEMILKNLNSFTGTEGYFYSKLYPNINYTDGVKYLWESCNCYWFLTDILGHISGKLSNARFIVVNLYKEENKKSCYVSYEDGNGNLLHGDNYSFTDFPLINSIMKNEKGETVKILPAMRLFFTNNVLMLTSEY